MGSLNKRGMKNDSHMIWGVAGWMILVLFWSVGFSFSWSSRILLIPKTQY